MAKFSPSHSAYIETAEKILKLLRKNKDVSKISLGIIKPKKSMSRAVTKPKVTLQTNHILLQVNSKLYNQEIRVYGKNLEEIINTIKHV